VTLPSDLYFARYSASKSSFSQFFYFRYEDKFFSRLTSSRTVRVPVTTRPQVMRRYCQLPPLFRPPALQGSRPGTLRPRRGLSSLDFFTWPSWDPPPDESPSNPGDVSTPLFPRPSGYLLSPRCVSSSIPPFLGFPPNSQLSANKPTCQFCKCQSADTSTPQGLPSRWRSVLENLNRFRSPVNPLGIPRVYTCHLV